MLCVVCCSLCVYMWCCVWLCTCGVWCWCCVCTSQDHGRLSGEHISKHSQKLSRSWSVVRGAVVCGMVCVVWVHEGVVLCDELCVVLFGVLRGGGVVWCVVCGVWVFYYSLSLSFSLSLFLSFSQFSSFSFSLSLFLSCSFLLLSCLPLSLLSSSSFSSLFRSRQQTLCKALINKRDVQL